MTHITQKGFGETKINFKSSSTICVFEFTLTTVIPLSGMIQGRVIHVTAFVSVSSYSTEKKQIMFVYKCVCPFPENCLTQHIKQTGFVKSFIRAVM